LHENNEMVHKAKLEYYDKEMIKKEQEILELLELRKVIVTSKIDLLKKIQLIFSSLERRFTTRIKVGLDHCKLYHYNLRLKLYFIFKHIYFIYRTQ
jgi:hypothetical protein